jgi:nitrite reductase/ring-hydroxylating ferredoxin subunit
MVEIDTARVLCTLAELEPDGCRGFTVGQGDWPLRGVVVRLGPATVRAWVNWCPHAGHPLNLKPHRFLTADGALLQCDSHGALFTRDEGLCISGPCAGRSLRPVPVQVQRGVVLLAPGADPEELADVSR